MKLILIFCLQIFLVVSLNAVPALEKLPQKAIDTLETENPDVRVVIYSNNTWKYYHPTLDERIDENPIFANHWDTTQVFAYKSIELKSNSFYPNRENKEGKFIC